MSLLLVVDYEDDDKLVDMARRVLTIAPNYFAMAGHMSTMEQPQVMTEAFWRCLT